MMVSGLLCAYGGRKEVHNVTFLLCASYLGPKNFNLICYDFYSVGPALSSLYDKYCHQSNGQEDLYIFKCYMNPRSQSLIN
jgi:hypothetical protein